ncbi:MAG: winged helix-turn-helix transcriptional regulator [Pseudomonadales bacterium]
MKYKSFDQMNCSLAQTLNILGERWTLLILRDAFFGAKRFGQFERNLGIAKNILTARLNMLVDEGIMEKRESHEGAHPEYVLTEQGLDLQPILLSMTHWGDKHRPHPRGDRLVFVDRESGEPIRSMSVVSQDGRTLKPWGIRAVPGRAMQEDKDAQVDGSNS